MFKKFTKNTNLLLVVLVVFLIFAFFITLSNENDTFKISLMPKPNSIPLSPQPTQTVYQDIAMYVNKDMGYTVKYPRLLLVDISKDTKDYFEFVKFKGNRFKPGNGFAIGISKKTVSEEIENVKKELNIQGGKEVGSKVTFVLGFNIPIYTFELIDKTVSIRSSFSVFEYKGRVFSVSASEADIESVLEGIGFVGRVIGCEDAKLSSNFQAYCSNKMCESSENKFECEAVDVVSISDGRLTEFSQDKIPDCRWVETGGAAGTCLTIW